MDCKINLFTDKIKYTLKASKLYDNNLKYG